MPPAGELKVVYSDLDGTLLGQGGSLFRDAAGGFTLDGARALELLSGHGLELSLVSGRSVRLLREDARLLGAGSFIAEAGCVVVREGGSVVEPNCAPFGEKQGMSVYEEIAATGAPDLLLEQYRGRLCYHEPWHGDHEYSHLMRGGISVEEANALLSGHGHGDLRLVDNGVIEDRGYGMAAEELHAYHLIPARAGKARAIALDLKLAGRSRDEAVACGDSAQDLEMAGVVKTLYLVANTPVARAAGGGAGVTGYDNVVVTDRLMVEGFLEAVGRALAAAGW